VCERTITETYLGVYFGVAYLALFATPLVIRLARRIGAVDHPGVRSVHTRPVPRIGGVAIYVSTACILLALLVLNHAVSDRFREVRPQVLTLLIAATGIFLVGLIDDLRGLPARCKFAAEVLGAVALCLVGVRIGSIGLGRETELALGWLGVPITILWIVGVTNAVNMSDGLDGLAAGVAAIACAVIAVLALHGSTTHTGPARSNDIMMALFALALLGSLTGFLFFNFNPAKIFMGDCGSLFVGFTIAAASVMCISKSAALVGLALPALALGVPIFDTLLAMLRRFLERRSLFAPDRSHFHHRMLDLGLNQRRAVLVIYAVTLIAAGLGLFMMLGNGPLALIVFAGVLALLVLVFRLVGAFGLSDTLMGLRKNYRCSCRQRAERRTFETLQLHFRQLPGDNAWWPAVCEAAEQMDFAWVSLETTHPDGRTDTEIWRPAAQPPAAGPQLLTMRMPLKNGHPDRSYELEFAICVNGSFESAGHRGTLFGRLLDETEPVFYR
jgi:UDP-GlcNAc:undecaprenyl-phosphate/decaprenyl-phosphate GlcNAc-1-phosphate transferase